MKNIFTFLIVMTLIGCSQEKGEQHFWKVADVTKSEERISILLEEDPSILNVYVKGQTNGSFQIIANGGMDNQIFQLQGGTIDTIFSELWKSATCKTIYVPKSITEGDISISTLIYPKD